ncbi:hypothetical protein PMAYCL1PPCAC_23257 [Pristionchus mayeri]|uniref:Non-structural maintenance of chromosomes element 1 homolog n=1 Tax=Pristionchus mayeri TaxID=1317129 RepID=A0AAN5CZU7_9BILA|nr:hypothetical protein PMAYCL1PPCAC_23257 [Pristionchus mayeri]
MGAAGDVFDFAKIVDASTEYSDAHRGLLKIMIDRGSLTEKAFYAHFVRCFATQHYLDEIDYDRNELNLKGVTKESVADLRKNLIDIMNAKTQHIGLRLMNAHDEVKNKKMIVLVSERHFSPAMAGASPFDSHNELFLVISWLEEMLKRDNDGYMCINDALRSAKNLPVPMKMEKAQQLIDQLFKDDWIRREAGEMLTLTTRALTELGPILRSRFHCATCCLCSNVTIRKASMLSCEECESLMHVSCWNNLAANANTEKVRCPGYNCKAMLSKEEMEESAKQIEEARVYGNRRRRLSSDSEPGPSKKKNGRGRKATKRTSNSESEPEEEEEVDMMMGNDDDEMEEDDDEIFVRQTQKKSRKQPRHSQGSSQKQPRKRSKDDEEDEDMMMEED